MRATVAGPPRTGLVSAQIRSASASSTSTSPRNCSKYGCSGLPSEPPPIVRLHYTKDMATASMTEAPARALTVLTEEERLFQSTVRRFAKEQIAPYVREMDEASMFRKDIIRQFFELGLMGIEIPEEYGGQGGTFFQCVLAVEELSAVDPSAGVIVDVQNTIVNNAILRWASAEQKRRYLPRLAENTVASYALSEAGSGSDAFALATRAVDQGDHFLLTGRKLWITNAAEAGLFLLFANVNPEAGYRGITAFLIERDFPGFQVGKKEDKLGIRASSTCELILDNCRVPRENVMGEIGKGYKIAIETLNEGRIAIGAQMIGLARGALEHSLAYAKQRKQFGKTIAEFQGVQFQLAVMATELEAARLLVYNGARLRDNRQPFVTEAAMAKYYASEVAEKVASKAIEIHGGVGITKDYPVEKLYRDAKIGRIYEGTSNIQLATIAKNLLGK
jgi:butyryl-CoA dehydrogenase/short/branched chain acyl-CoA dehydrogenase